MKSIISKRGSKIRKRMTGVTKRRVVVIHEISLVVSAPFEMIISAYN